MMQKLIIFDSSRTSFTPYISDKTKGKNIQLSYKINNNLIEIYAGTKFLGRASNWEYVKGIYPELYEQYQYDLMLAFFKTEAYMESTDGYWFERFLGFKEFKVTSSEIIYKNKNRQIKTLEELIDIIDSWF